MERWVEIAFDCLPLRSVTRLDAPIDASPKYQDLCRRIKQAIDKHGTHNAYFLYNAHCIYHLMNHAELGRLEFTFEGTVLTDDQDLSCRTCDLQVKLQRETCDWLTQPIVNWFTESVSRSVAVEFDRFIQAGDLQRAKERIEQIQRACDESGGYVGMYL
jgi:hypothetical protein